MEKLPQITEVKHRIPSFDILRIILVVLVINIHRENFTGALALFPNRFGWYAVPTFIILSFYLTSNFYLNQQPAFKSVVKRSKRFFVPFIFWSAVGFIVTPQAFNLRNVIMQLATGGVINVPLYYLLIMSLFTIIFWLLTHIPVNARIVGMVALLFTSFYLQYSGINYSFFSALEPAVMYCYGRIAELLPFAITGLIFGHLASRKTNSVHTMLLTGLVGGFYFAAQTTTQPGGVDYSGTLLYFGSVFIFLYFFLIRHYRLPMIAEKIISTLGAYSFGVYASHYLGFELIFKYMPLTKQFNEAFPLLFLLIFTGLSYGAVIGADKLTRHRFSYLFR